METIDDLILLQTSTSINQLDMVTRIGICRKRVMQLLRLLSSKSDVIKTLMKRFDERQYNNNTGNLNFLDYSSSSSLESLHPTQPLTISASSSPSTSPSPPPPSSINHYHYTSNHPHPSIDESIITNNSSIISTTPTITKNNHHHLHQKSFDQLPSLASSVPHFHHHHHSSSPSSRHKKKISYSECLWHQNENEEDDRIYPDVGLYFGDVYGKSFID